MPKGLLDYPFVLNTLVKLIPCLNEEVDCSCQSKIMSVLLQTLNIKKTLFSLEQKHSTESFNSVELISDRT